MPDSINKGLAESTTMECGIILALNMRALVGCRQISCLRGVILLALIWVVTTLLLLNSSRSDPLEYQVNENGFISEIDDISEEEFVRITPNFLIKDPELSSTHSLACFPNPLGLTDEEFLSRFPNKEFSECPKEDNIIFHENG